MPTFLSYLMKAESLVTAFTKRLDARVRGSVEPSLGRDSRVKSVECRVYSDD
jgi:hypothetical protein